MLVNPITYFTANGCMAGYIVHLLNGAYELHLKMQNLSGTHKIKVIVFSNMGNHSKNAHFCQVVEPLKNGP